MSKKTSSHAAGTEAEAFEMIELAIDDMEVLTRAFRFIDDLCREANEEQEGKEEAPPALVLH